jgi:uncharacterized membrane protein required for colicin V production
MGNALRPRRRLRVAQRSGDDVGLTGTKAPPPTVRFVPLNRDVQADLSFNWFDLTALVFIVVGIFVGRRRGMSSELLPVLQWLAIVFLAALACDPFGRMLADISGLSALLMFVTAYLLTALGIKLAFFFIKRAVGEKLIGKDVFGNFEYYLGMTAGAIRFTCILLFALALLNARQVSEKELSTQISSQRESLGSIFFPPFGSIQRYVFERSFTGRMTKEYLSAQLINVDPSAGTGASRENIGQMRSREIDDAMKLR